METEEEAGRGAEDEIDVAQESALEIEDYRHEEQIELTFIGEKSEAASLQYSPFNQYLVLCIVSGLASLSIGTVLGFSAILLPQLEDEGQLGKNSSESSWIASLSTLGQLLGSLLTGALSSVVGRRAAIIALCLPLGLGWLLCAASVDLTAIYFGRFLQGVGIMSSVTQVYLVEAADGRRRGLFGASGALTVSTGITLIYSLGASFNWRVACAVCGSIPVIVSLLMLTLPETPNWLVSKGRLEDAEKSLLWLRGNCSSAMEKELSALQQSRLSAEENEGRSRNLFGILSKFLRPGTYKPFLLLLAVFILQQSSGSFAVIFYAVNIFKDIFSPNELNEESDFSYISTIATGLMRLLGALFGTLLVGSGKFGRKKLMFASALIMALSMTVLALDRSQFAWIKVTAVLLYMLSFGCGVGTVPWILLGELCPADVKGVASGITTFVTFGTIFTVVKTFPWMKSVLGIGGVFGLYAVISFITAAFSLFVLPETGGLTLAEIQDMFNDHNDDGVERNEEESK